MLKQVCRFLVLRHRSLLTICSDNINLTVPFLDDASNEIVATYANANQTSHRKANGCIIDVHGHIEPDWYRAIQPITGAYSFIRVMEFYADSCTAGSPTSQWDIESWLAFMDI